ncbi:MAG TPA: universal stress protein [Vicinamibacterales bacterium]|nr:universal stress protein [Vicinamibacterales bacterium]
MEIRRVLCPVDFSEFSRRALHHAAAIAEWYAAELYVLHAHLEIAPVPVPLLVPEPSADMGADMKAALHQFISQSDVGRSPKEIVRAGDPVPTILACAREIGADLIVMGTHGHSGFERALLGSTTERVLHKAPCPVLTIPRLADEPGSAERVRFTRVLCAVDFSPSSVRALEHGIAFAEESEAGLILLHVLPVLSDEDARTQGHFRIAEYVRTRTDDIRRELAALVPEEARSWCDVKEMVELGAPAQRILATADRENADLIVMGAQGRNGLGLILFGSTTQTVVRRATCPVLTVRA